MYDSENALEMWKLLTIITSAILFITDTRHWFILNPQNEIYILKIRINPT